MIYLDSSALVKLAHPEPHSDQLRAWLAVRSARTMIASALARAETVRALRRHDPAALPRVPALLDRLHLLPIDTRILERAEALPDPLLRTLEAIHLATALALGVPELTFVTYDRRLSGVVTEHGLTVAAPSA